MNVMRKVFFCGLVLTAVLSGGAWATTLTASDVLTRPDAVLADPSGDHGPLGSCVVIGPEGGFSPDEWELCPRRVCLGGTVLRVETAALVAAVRSLAG